MQTLVPFLTIVFFLNSALASGTHFFTDRVDITSQSSGKSNSLSVQNSSGYFCILSELGGGDSGGGIWPQGVESKLKPHPSGDDRLEGGESDDDFLLHNHEGADLLVEVAMSLGAQPLSAENPVYRNPILDIVELFNCDHGRGIPASARGELILLLDNLIEEAEEFDADYDVKLLEDLIAVLNTPLEI